MFKGLYLNAGQMKAGTTFLYGILRNHPDIYFSPEKELHYISQNYGGVSLLNDNLRYRKARALIESANTNDYGIDILRNKIRWIQSFLEFPLDNNWYLRLFDGAKPNQFAADFSNLTCTIPQDGLAQLKSDFANTRITYCVREPVSRAISHMKFHLKVAGKPHDLNEMSNSDLSELIRSENIFPQSKTSDHIEKFSSVFSEGEFGIIVCERMWADPQSAVDNICRFLGIEGFKLNENLNRVVNRGPALSIDERVVELVTRELDDEIHKARDSLEKHEDLILN
jgi:hypothetical protein